MQATLSPEQWRRVGGCIRRFHDAGVYHADLNAHNILLGSGPPVADEVYLIDFDRGERRAAEAAWQQANLQRLMRSLEKLARSQDSFHFTDAGWSDLIAGWRG